MINFESDYTEGCIPEILEAITVTNTEQTSGYGVDPHCENARKMIKKACRAPKADVQFLVGGTQANTVVISSILKPYQGVICAETGHINVHETGAIEATGHKCLVIPGQEGKLSAEALENSLKTYWADATAEHMVEPGLVYISWPTETGTLYKKEEMLNLSKVCKKYKIPLFCDGARMGYGLASPACDMTLADFARICDVFYIGGTKVGALFGEAVVIVNPSYQTGFRNMIKQKGGMLAKGRLLGIQFEELFKNDRYLKISAHAMKMAGELAAAFQEHGYPFAYEPQSNQLFPILDNKLIKRLRKTFAFQDSVKINEELTCVRFVTSFMTTEENVRKLIRALR